MRDYRKLEVWRLGRQFAVSCYQATSKFPKEEIYGLTSQIRRASVSIAANIAEGSGRDSDGEFLRFLRIALGSLNEVETLLMIATDLEFLANSEFGAIEENARDLGVRLRNLAQKVEADITGKAKQLQS